MGLKLKDQEGDEEGVTIKKIERVMHERMAASERSKTAIKSPQRVDNPNVRFCLWPSWPIEEVSWDYQNLIPLPTNEFRGMQGAK